MNRDIELFNKLVEEMQESENSECECSYCHDPSPSRDCCYFDTNINKWVEQQLISDFDNSNNIEDLFSNMHVYVHIVNRCPKCGRKLE